MVARSYNGGMWVIIARDVATSSYMDTGLASSTTYQYTVTATSADGFSPPSVPATARTGSLADSLVIQPLVITVTRKQPFNGVVATFTDANTLAAAGSFVAVIRWGDGGIEPGDGRRLERPVHGIRPAQVRRRGPIRRQGGRDDVRAVPGEHRDDQHRDGRRPAADRQAGRENPARPGAAVPSALRPGPTARPIVEGVRGSGLRR